jgi:hypothetical protein
MAPGVSAHGEASPARGTAGLTAGIAAFVFLGVPLLAYVWETLNDLLAGHWNPRRFLIAIPAFLLLLLLGRICAGVVQRWDRARPRGPSSEPLP